MLPAFLERWRESRGVMEADMWNYIDTLRYAPGLREVYDRLERLAGRR